jgi:hypothetical protein
MNADRIQVQHAEEQVWQLIRSFRADMERIAENAQDLEAGDENLIKAVFSYVLAKMDIIDIDLEDEDE